MTTSTFTCGVCGSIEGASTNVFPETMFQTKESFGYLRCDACGCVQIADLPADMSAYYPDTYYSFAEAPAALPQRLKGRARDLLTLFGPEWLFGGRDWWHQGDLRSVRRANTSKSDAILDLGCGAGRLLRSLAGAGYQRLTGADPYISGDIEGAGYRVLKREYDAIVGQFDLVMMHHSLEHMADQAQVVARMFDLTRPGGRMLIRIPTIDCSAFEIYGGDWVQIDPPRHFFLHSRRSIRLLVERAGFRVVDLYDDSHAYQFWGSELARRGIPIMTAHGQLTRPSDHFSAQEFQEFGKRARRLNLEGQGDSIAVIAERPRA